MSPFQRKLATLSRDRRFLIRGALTKQLDSEFVMEIPGQLVGSEP